MTGLWISEGEAVSWCDERKLRYVKFPVPPLKKGDPERITWEVSGWAWPKDSSRDKTRIHVLGNTLVEAALKAKVIYDAVTA